MSVERIRAELEAATPGPWEPSERLSESDDTAWGVLAWHAADEEYHMVVTTLGECDNGLIVDDTNRMADARLIAHAPTYLAALLDVAEALQSIADRHPDALPDEHPAVDIARAALAALESTPSAP